MLAAVVVIGLVLLAKAAPSSSTTVATRDRSNVTSTSTTSPPETTTTAPTTTTTGVAHPVAEVKVVVLNGSGGKRGVGASNTVKIKAKGYNTLSPGNAVARPTTAVFYAAGYAADAVEVAKMLGLGATSTMPVPTPSPAPGGTEANVIVVLGEDTPTA